MAGRYLISGADLGTIEGLLKGKELDMALKELKRISDENFLGNSEVSVKEDIKKLSKCL